MSDTICRHRSTAAYDSADKAGAGTMKPSAAIEQLSEKQRRGGYGNRQRQIHPRLSARRRMNTRRRQWRSNGLFSMCKAQGPGHELDGPTRAELIF